MSGVCIVFTWGFGSSLEGESRFVSWPASIELNSWGWLLQSDSSRAVLAMWYFPVLAAKTANWNWKIIMRVQETYWNSVISRNTQTKGNSRQFDISKWIHLMSVFVSLTSLRLQKGCAVGTDDQWHHTAALRHNEWRRWMPLKQFSPDEPRGQVWRANFGGQSLN